MKICPKCKKEFDDSLNFCTEDHTELESIESLEGDILAEEDSPVIEDYSANESTDSDEEEILAATTAEEIVEEQEEEEEEEEDQEPIPARAATTTAAAQPGGMSAMAKGLIIVAVIFAIGGGLVFWKNKVEGQHYANLNRITEQEMQILLKDANPMLLKRLAEDPEMKKQQVDQLKQLLAVASQARKEGLADETNIRMELENMADETLARNYDQEINKDKGPMPPFGYIGEDRIKEFWGTEGAREDEFKQFFDARLELMKEFNPAMADKEPSEEEVNQFKDEFAKIQIYAEEAREKMKSGELGEEFKQKVELQTKLQQANFLASVYSKKMAEKAEVTDAEVDEYIAGHADLDPKAKKAKAEDILKRALGGEDFAKLADEFSEDPGNMGPEGKKNGGLYENVTKGKMVPEFEKAALALEPGKVSPELVETQFGYHIIKLDKKGETKDEKGQAGESYDVRHILIMTNAKDPDDPMAKEMPVKEMVKGKLSKEKQKKLLDEILANNPVEVPEDFKVPEVSEEEMQKMQQQMQQQQMQQQQMQPPPGGGAPPPPAPKPEPKK